MMMTLKNSEIYNYANALAQEFGQQEVKLPLKVNFYLQKNLKELVALAQDIEQQRVSIASEYGTLNEETQQYEIPPENIDSATRKLNELFNLTQDVKIYKVKLDAFGDTDISNAQMQALLFMIDEEE
jgi:hypothetical protein